MVSFLLAGAMFLVGLLFGPTVESLLAKKLPEDYEEYSRKIMYANVDSALEGQDAWMLHEREGRRYEWEVISEGDHPDQLVTADDRMFEDVGFMGHLRINDSRIAFGCTFDSHRVVTSPLVAGIAEEFGKLSTDAPQLDHRLMTDGGGDIDDDGNPNQTPAFRDELTVDYFRDNALLGRGFDSGHIVEVVNGAVGIPKARVADVKATENLLAHAGDPEQPVRTAENAENAERARTGPESTLAQLKGPAYFIGGLLTFYTVSELAGGGGGGGDGGDGGGGGGTDLPTPFVEPPDLTPVVDILTSGVFA